MLFSDGNDQKEIKSFADNCEPIRRLITGCGVNIDKYRHQPTGLICAAKQQSVNYGSNIELKILKKFDSNRIIKYFDHCFKRLSNIDKLIIFMELADMTLSSYVGNVGVINDPVTFRSIAAQLVEGVCILHSEGIVHRDLSYYNILVRGNCFKISDFDVAAFSNNLSSVVGYFAINPPEMAFFEHYDEKVDVWGLGCSLYYLATGHLPFDSSRNLKTLMSDVGEKIGFPEHFLEAARNFIGWLGDCSIKLPFTALINQIGFENWHLIYNCLKVDPMKRPTAFNLYEHPTFYNYFDYQKIPYATRNWW